MNLVLVQGLEHARPVEAYDALAQQPGIQRHAFVEQELGADHAIGIVPMAGEADAADGVSPAALDRPAATLVHGGLKIQDAATLRFAPLGEEAGTERLHIERVV